MSPRSWKAREGSAVGQQAPFRSFLSDLMTRFGATDEAELCLSHPRDGRSHRHVVVISITRIPWRKVGKRDYSLPTSVPTMNGP